MKVLIIINDAPYGTEKAYNALRMAMTLQREHGVDVKIFLLADAVFCALPNQKTPDGYYNIEKMFKSVIQKGGEVKACGSCMDARGLADLKLIEGVKRSNMKEFSEWVIKCDKMLEF